MKNRVFLDLNYFEFGFLYASIRKDAWDRMPMRLCLLLKIAFTKAYLKHEKFGKQAKKDLKNYEEQLRNLKQ